MFFSRIRLRPEATESRDFWEQLDQGTYPTHEMIWRFFADDYERKRDFIFRYDVMKGLPGFLCVSSREPVGFSGVWEIDEPKLYAPKIHEGQRFSFMLRANPVKKRSVNDGPEKKERIIRHDVVMDAKVRMDYKNLPVNERPEVQEIVHQAGTTWLAEKGAMHGFAIDAEEIHTDAYQTHSFWKPSAQRPISFSTIDFSGILTVTHPEKFTNALFYGIGPAKGFGCGMMMIKPLRVL
ncbi:type I-E CRISPR-associated protein Cas6/Cse3/CasE [Methanosphaerula subterraneus]|uniref:type I-E CRISPR-associated protein Cas6/Cse3/CasE n=1 Tax=Methanosphaerula subterraneus TaxID=3350244 RepID=UPI003F8669EB